MICPFDFVYVLTITLIHFTMNVKKMDILDPVIVSRSCIFAHLIELMT